jgi:hypothetical protein
MASVRGDLGVNAVAMLIFCDGPEAHRPGQAGSLTSFAIASV